MKSAIVTGASGGIGSAIALKLLKDGYYVYAQYNTNIEGINRLKTEAEKIGASAFLQAEKFDITDSAQIDSAISKVKRVDVLVNCAGVGLYKLAIETSEKEWKDLFDVNVTGMQMLTVKVLNQMISEKRGKIVNVSSIWGNVGASMEVCYSASKSAIIGYTKALAKEVGYSGINVNCVCPGVIDTKMNARFSKEEMAELVDQTPMGRIGKAEDVANLVSFLVSDEAEFITGQIITVDGGFTL
ncbi:MAG: SDR family oxidoreductase [Clostridia bacterium]|nr:SDR family oxidoreductase [Clostridia bacterium]